MELVDFVADALKFHHLRVVAIGDFDHEFAFRESTCEGLGFFEDFKGTGEFKRISHDFEEIVLAEVTFDDEIWLFPHELALGELRLVFGEESVSFVGVFDVGDYQIGHEGH